MLIYPEKEDNKIQFRIRVQKSIYQEIEEYCKWAHIQYKDYFISRACQYIFLNDDEWVKYKSQENIEKSGGHEPNS